MKNANTVKMKNIDKKEIKKFLDTYPFVEFSAAKFEYSLHLDLEFTDKAEQFIENSFEMSEQDLIDMKTVDEISAPEELLRFMRKPVSRAVKNKLMKKVLKNEADMLPLIKEKCLKSLQDIFIENALDFFIRSEANCCDWILESYSQFRSEYLKSMFCLVLGFRGEVDSIPFLMNEAERFLNDYPDETYDQGPALAVEELVIRFFN